MTDAPVAAHVVYHAIGARVIRGVAVAEPLLPIDRVIITATLTVGVDMFGLAIVIVVVVG